MDLKSTYDRIARDWNNDHTNDDWWVEGVAKFTSLLDPGATVLDVGCGSGVKSEILQGKGMKVTGIDFSEGMLEIAKRRVPNGNFLSFDLYDLSGLTEKFDAIFAQAVLLHIPKKDVGGIIHSLKGKLNTGGYFYIAVKERRDGEGEEELVKENDYGYDYERFFSYFTAEEMRKFLLDEGLEIVYEIVTHSGRRNWIQLIGKYR
ncbi:MAG: class I SAM-dependent methyltransferase [Candidatus Pacebacteria bacterium]|nr:class I SAM-dependent methyltransferase [Candidatus Paceibacterota bacterium]